LATTSITIRDLLDAGVHFGHPTSRWNPKMKPYIYGKRNGIYIFDLTATMRQLDQACKFLYETSANGGSILFVGTKRQAQELIRNAAEQTGMHYMCERWLGWTLTNNQTIRKSIARMQMIQQKLENGELDALPKKEASGMKRELVKLQRYLGGIANMRQMPQALVVIDVDREDIAVTEANRLNIPVVALVDTNCDPQNIDYVIPGNDDALRSVSTVMSALVSAISSAREIYLKKVEEDERQRQEEAKAKAEARAKAEAENKAKAEARATEGKAKAEPKSEAKAEAPAASDEAKAASDEKAKAAARKRKATPKSEAKPEGAAAADAPAKEA
jgi:small subunit ribosomal protein S2